MDRAIPEHLAQIDRAADELFSPEEEAQLAAAAPPAARPRARRRTWPQRLHRRGRPVRRLPRRPSGSGFRYGGPGGRTRGRQSSARAAARTRVSSRFPSGGSPGPPGHRVDPQPPGERGHPPVPGGHGDAGTGSVRHDLEGGADARAGSAPPRPPAGRPRTPGPGRPAVHRVGTDGGPPDQRPGDARPGRPPPASTVSCRLMWTSSWASTPSSSTSPSDPSRPEVTTRVGRLRVAPDGHGVRHVAVDDADGPAGQSHGGAQAVHQVVQRGGAPHSSLGRAPTDRASTIRARGCHSHATEPTGDHDQAQQPRPGAGRPRRPARSPSTHAEDQPGTGHSRPPPSPAGWPRTGRRSRRSVSSAVRSSTVTAAGPATGASAPLPLRGAAGLRRSPRELPAARGRLTRIAPPSLAAGHRPAGPSRRIPRRHSRPRATATRGRGCGSRPRLPATAPPPAGGGADHPRRAVATVGPIAHGPSSVRPLSAGLCHGPLG